MTTATWKITEPQLGMQAIDTLDTTQNHGLGKMVRATHSTNGEGTFMYAQFPASTAFAAGILLQWDKNYLVVTVPVGSSSKLTGVAVGTIVAPVSSNAAIQYGWVQVVGQVPVLKTAVTVSPQSPIYISNTAGRLKVLVSAGMTILGARTANTATITSTTSTVLVYLNESSMMGS